MIQNEFLIASTGYSIVFIVFSDFIIRFDITEIVLFVDGLF